MKKTKERVTLTRMRARLAENCQQQFYFLRRYHDEYLRAKREGDYRREAHYSATMLQARFAAVRVYDLYLEAQGYSFQAHLFKQNDRDMRRIHQNMKELEE